MTVESKFGLLTGLATVIVVAVFLYQKRGEELPAPAGAIPKESRPHSLNPAGLPTDPVLNTRPPEPPKDILLEPR